MILSELLCYAVTSSAGDASVFSALSPVVGSSSFFSSGGMVTGRRATMRLTIAESRNSAELTKTPQLTPPLTASARVVCAMRVLKLWKHTALAAIIRLASRLVTKSPLLSNFLKFSSRNTRLTGSESALSATKSSASSSRLPSDG